MHKSLKHEPEKSGVAEGGLHSNDKQDAVNKRYFHSLSNHMYLNHNGNVGYFINFKALVSQFYITGKRKTRSA